MVFDTYRAQCPNRIVPYNIILIYAGSFAKALFEKEGGTERSVVTGVFRSKPHHRRGRFPSPFMGGKEFAPIAAPERGGVT